MRFDLLFLLDGLLDFFRDLFLGGKFVDIQQFVLEFVGLFDFLRRGLFLDFGLLGRFLRDFCIGRLLCLFLGDFFRLFFDLFLGGFGFLGHFGLRFDLLFLLDGLLGHERFGIGDGHLEGLLPNEALGNQRIGIFVGNGVIHLRQFTLCQSGLPGGGGDQIQRVLCTAVIGDAVQARHGGVFLGGGRLDLVLGVRILGGIQRQIQIQRFATNGHLGQLIAAVVETVVLPTDATAHLFVAQQFVLQTRIVLLAGVGCLCQLGHKGLDKAHADFVPFGVHSHDLQHFVLALFLGFLLGGLFLILDHRVLGRNLLGLIFGNSLFRLFGFFDFLLCFDLLFDDVFGRFFGLFACDDGLFCLLLGGLLLDLGGGFFAHGLDGALLAANGLPVFQHHHVHLFAMLGGRSVIGLLFDLAFGGLIAQQGNQDHHTANDGECNTQADGKRRSKELLCGDVRCDGTDNTHTEPPYSMFCVHDAMIACFVRNARPQACAIIRAITKHDAAKRRRSVRKRIHFFYYNINLMFFQSTINIFATKYTFFYFFFAISVPTLEKNNGIHAHDDGVRRQKPTPLPMAKVRGLSKRCERDQFESPSVRMHKGANTASRSRLANTLITRSV